MEIISDHGRMLSMEIVEVNPVIDEHNQTADLAVELARVSFRQKDSLARVASTLCARPIGATSSHRGESLRFHPPRQFRHTRWAVCGSRCNRSFPCSPVSTPTTPSTPAFVPACKSSGVSPTLITSRTLVTPAASIARKIMGAGRPIGTSLLEIRAEKISRHPASSRINSEISR